MMDRFFRKNQGSISVLLSIIMLPSLLFSGLLIDFSNRQMSKAMVESAGELAMSSALSKYDAVLEDVYGLFAMSQNYDDLLDKVKQYMKDTMDASGLLEGTDYGAEIINSAVDMINAEVGELGNNFIQAKVEVKEAKGLANSALSQPQVIKNQIVEHMKYRGIQIVAQDLLSTLKQFGSLDAKTVVADQKMEVAEKQEDLSDAAQAFYMAIVQMDGLVEEVEKQYNLLYGKQEDGTIINRWGNPALLMPQTELQSVINALMLQQNTVTSWMWNGNLDLFLACDDTLDESVKEYTYYVKEVPDHKLSTAGTEVEASGLTEIPFYEVRDLRDSRDRAVSASTRTGSYETVEEWLRERANELRDQTTELKQYGFQFLDQHEMTICGVKYTVIKPHKDAYDKFAEFITTLSRLTAELRYVYDEVQDMKEELEEASGDEEGEDGEEEEGNTSSDSAQEEYDKWNNLLVKYANSVYTRLKEVYDGPQFAYHPNKQLINVLGSGGKTYAFGAKLYFESIESYKEGVGIQFGKGLNLIQPYYKSIKDALEAKAKQGWWDLIPHTNYFDYVVKLGEKVKDNVRELQEANGTYGDLIDDYENDPNGGSDEFSAQMKSEQQANKAIFTEQDVEEVLIQVRAVKDFLEKEEKSISDGKIYQEELEYDTKYESDQDFKDLGDKLVKAAKQAIKAYRDANPDMDYFLLCNRTWPIHISVKQVPTLYKKDSYTKQVKELRTIEIEDGTVVKIPVPKFYIYLASTYPLDESKKSDTEEGNIEEVGDREPEKTSTDSVEIPDDAFSDLDLSFGQKEGGQNPGKGGSGKSKMLKQFKAYSELFRGLVDACKDLSNPENIRDDLLVTTYIYENFSNFMDAEKPSNRRTMTNMLFSEGNNVLFGCEAEYILYGDHDSPQSNVQVVKGNIFAIRFIANCIFAICDGTINAYTLSPALAIQAATLGVFPYKVAQVVLDIILGLCETIYDVEKIMGGGEVPLFKSIQTWVCQPSGVTQILKDASAELVTDTADKIKDTLHDLVNSTVDHLEEGINKAASDITSDLNTTLRGYIKKAVGTLSQLISSELTKLLNQVYTGSIPSDMQDLSSETISGRLKEVLRNYLRSAQAGKVPNLSEPVATFLEGHVDGMVDKVMSAKAEIDGKTITISSLIDQVNQQYQDLINTETTGTIQVNPAYFEALLNSVSSGLTGYLDSIQSAIDSKVAEWTGSFAEDVKSTLGDCIDKETDKLSAQASQAVSNLIDEKIGEYFPSESSVGFDNEGTASSGTLKNMFNFGYTDYLRLFLYLNVSNNKKESAMLTRVGDVITMNRVKGLADYYTSKVGAPTKKEDSGVYSYSMGKAYTYMTITAEVKVKPMILGSAWFSADGAALKGASDTITGSNFWTYQYSTTGGY